MPSRADATKSTLHFRLHPASQTSPVCWFGSRYTRASDAGEYLITGLDPGEGPGVLVVGRDVDTEGIERLLVLETFPNNNPTRAANPTKGSNRLDSQPGGGYAAHQVGRLTSLWEIVRRFNAVRWQGFSEILSELKALSADERVEYELRASLVRLIGWFEDECEAMGLTASAITIRKMGTALSDPAVKVKYLGALADELRGRITDEMGAAVYLSLTPGEASLYNSVAPFGEDVPMRFPSAQVDIEEATKSFALGRYTAAVFHLMRVMEICLRVLGLRLGLSSTSNRGWDAILGKAHSMMTQPWAGKPPEWASDEPFLSEAIAMLTAVKTAWRNPTMHVENIYTAEQAEEVWRAVRGFARHLATRLSEAAPEEAGD